MRITVFLLILHFFGTREQSNHLEASKQKFKNKIVIQGPRNLALVYILVITIELPLAIKYIRPHEAHGKYIESAGDSVAAS